MVSVTSYIGGVCTRYLDEHAEGQKNDPVAIAIVSLSWWKRAIPLSRGRHLPGYSVTWPGQPSIPVESRLEHRVLKALVAEDACLAIASQPLTIGYEVDGSARRYTPDFLVALRASPTPTYAFLEVKPNRRRTRICQPLSVIRGAVYLATRIPLVLIAEEDLFDAQLKGHRP